MRTNPAPVLKPTASPTAYSVSWVRDDDGVKDLIQEWEGARSRFAGVTYTQDLERAALERSHRSLNVSFLTVRKGDELVGYAPVIETTAPMPISFGLKTLLKIETERLRMIGGDVVIAENADETGVLSALFGYLESRGVKLLTIEECAESSRIHRAADTLGAYRMKPLDGDSQMIHTIDLPESFDAYLKSHKGKTRNTLKRRVRVFNEKFDGNARLKRFSSSEDVHSFVQAVEEIFGKSWKKGVLSEESPLNSEDIPYLQALAERGLLRSYVLYGGERPICASIVTQHNGVCDFLDVIYDQEFSQLAPGQVLIFQIIEDLYAHDTPSEFNFGYGDNNYKRVFGNRSYAANYYYAFRPYTKPAALVSTQIALRKGYNFARKTAVALEIDQKLRRLLKRGAKQAT